MNIDDFEKFLNKKKRYKIQLGDYICIGNIMPNGRTQGLLKGYRCIGVNPNVKLQNVITVNGSEELTDDIITLTDKQLNNIRPLGSINYSWTLSLDEEFNKKYYPNFHDIIRKKIGN